MINKQDIITRIQKWAKSLKGRPDYSVPCRLIRSIPDAVFEGFDEVKFYSVESNHFTFSLHVGGNVAIVFLLLPNLENAMQAIANVNVYRTFDNDDVSDCEDLLSFIVKALMKDL